MAVRITFVIEDNASSDPALHAEHGLSYWVQTPGGNLLFDTGSSFRAAANAGAMGLPLERLETIAVSHSHYDHGEGLFHFLDGIDSRPTVHVSTGYFDPKYSRSGGELAFKGVSYGREELAVRASIQEHEEPVVEILDSVYLVRDFPRIHDDEVDNPRFVLRAGENAVLVDRFTDEQLVVIDSMAGLLVIVGCSHPGIMNMIAAVESRFPKPIAAVIGGFHLIDAAERRIERTIDFFRKRDIPRLAPCHCTGKPAVERFAALPGFLPVTTGTVITV